MTTINTLSMPISSANAVTMSSKEIAELTGKAHKHVIRDIESMIAEIEKDGPSLDHKAKSKGYDVERDNRGYVKIIHLDRSHTYTLMTGYDARQRKKIIDRWMELEAQERKPLVPQTYAEALLEAGRIAKERDALKVENKELAVKAEALDRISFSEGEFGQHEVAKMIQVKPGVFTKFLDTNRWRYARGKVKLAYQDRIDAGYMRNKAHPYTDNNGEEHLGNTIRITTKGLLKFAQIVPGAKLDPVVEDAMRPFAKKRETEPA
ncbi:phage antirepressor KilAC domain-containing protein [Komagataeibacter oboediens]|uniref:phage antirepressor KilAC domain-containing protein n=1 Tax=Komagataeibacter oboediens TaxID=65958 RepID=UPI000237F3B7|nr:phage regulatory protein/antirepressor Ant [Komagataeibacter oboediens]